MQPIKSEQRPRTVMVRLLRKGDHVRLDSQTAVVSDVEWADGLIHFGKTARAMKISFLTHEPIIVHPGQELELV